MEDIHHFISPLGTLLIKGGDAGISEVGFVDADVVITPCPSALRNCRDQLASWFDRRSTSFDVKLDLKGTAFQVRVWDELLRIPFGRTLTYLELARRLGDERLTRAVAAANAANPVALIVPCHRVIGSNGSLTGYRGGLWRKKWLLDFEKRSLQTRLEI